MVKKLKFVVIPIFIVIIGIITFFINSNDKSELKTIKSEKELLRIYDGDDSVIKDISTGIFTMPFSFLLGGFYYGDNGILSRADMTNSSVDSFSKNMEPKTLAEGTSSEGLKKLSSSKDYSTTNIQVENVDEADITKTDGDYIFSISDNNVIITNVKNPKDIKIEAKINLSDGCVPEDLILYKNELVVISTKNIDTRAFSYNNYKNNTNVKIYNIEVKSNPTLVKSYELYEPYYTSRCINNELYVIASGQLKKENDKIVRTYKENDNEQEIALENIKYLKDVKTRKQTLISTVDLDNITANVNISSYLMDISNAYVSENSIYLLEQKYESDSNTPSIKDLFGLKGIIGVFKDNDYSSGYNTKIYKFDILKNGQVSYNTKNKIEGKTINQYSLDEKNGHLRVALYDYNGARVAIFDENLKQIGISNYVAKGETMYSSRFMDNKAYLVTYKTMDPLFVIDLSNEVEPKVLGELHIPGYSTYLHPYDENHIIGIGMETKEVVNKDLSGRVISTTSTITGMKMALFDVTDVNNPVQTSQTVIGDSRTTSAILTNPKALLFSKEKQLIAIPVNNYDEDFSVEDARDTYLSMIDSYTNYNKSYVGEGYFVYKLNLQDGFKLKGIIKHEASQNNNNNSIYYNYYNTSKLLRGLYIDDNLYTISEMAVKVNRLDTLELVDELKIK